LKVDALQALILGIIQGLTEFLPISSSGHLIVVPDLLGWEEHDLTFDVALHVGTFAAVLAYFRRDWLRFFRSFLRDASEHGMALAHFRPDSRLLLLLALGSLPAGVVGIVFGDAIEDNPRGVALVASMLIAVGALMWVAEMRGRRSEGLESVGLGRAMLIGAAQAVALIPGTSRAGITISAGLFAGMTREAAARFSFLLATPAIAGAALVELPDLFSNSSDTGTLPVAVGTLSSAAVGFVAIWFLLRFLQTNSLRVFVVYRLTLGLTVLLALLAR
jgi:undecaprenyl-diphosphatase